MKCQGTIAERTVPIGSEFVESASGEAERVIRYETTPEHPCEAEASMVSRSMREADDGRWEREGPDRAYCETCFVPGRMTHRDGRATQHPAMAIEDYGG